MLSAHFQNLPDLICRYLAETTREAQIAVCWFSHKGIFETLLNCARRGVRITLVLEYDTQNIRQGGLDFAALIQAGASFYACRDAALMHHKFALLDGRLLLSGSYNWTYNSNAENLIVSDDPALVGAFLAAFCDLTAKAERLFHIRRGDAKPFSTSPLFENTCHQLPELRKHVGAGAGAWHLRLDKLYRKPQAVLTQYCLPFDPEGLLAPYWAKWPYWEPERFDEQWKTWRAGHPYPLLRTLRLWTRCMKTGDLLFASTEKGTLAAIGMVQTDPMPFDGGRFSACRAVQWVKLLEPPLALAQASALPVCRFRGSALEVLQAAFF